MRNLFYLLTFFASHAPGFGQRTEFSIQAGSGLFSYRGPNAVNETGIYFTDGFYVSNPYGRASGLSYSLAGQIQHIAQSNWIYGMQTGYEQLTSCVAIASVTGYFGIPMPITRRVDLQNTYLNVNPFVGKRFGNDQLCLDATVGLDAGIGLVSRLKTSGEQTGPLPYAEPRWPIPDVDIRPRVNLTGYYQAYGLSIGYSYGLSNYTPAPYTTKASTYAQYWRAGVIYRLGSRLNQ